MRHLDDANWQALQRGDAEAQGYFAAHLQAGCDTCETFLIEVEDPALDGATDALLISAGPPASRLDRGSAGRSQPSRASTSLSVLDGRITASAFSGSGL